VREREMRVSLKGIFWGGSESSFIIKEEYSNSRKNAIFKRDKLNPATNKKSREF